MPTIVNLAGVALIAFVLGVSPFLWRSFSYRRTIRRYIENGVKEALKDESLQIEQPRTITLLTQLANTQASEHTVKTTWISISALLHETARSYVHPATWRIKILRPGSDAWSPETPILVMYWRKEWHFIPFLVPHLPPHQDITFRMSRYVQRVASLLSDLPRPDPDDVSPSEDLKPHEGYIATPFLR